MPSNTWLLWNSRKTIPNLSWPSILAWLRKVSLGSEAPFAKVTVVVPASTKPSGRAWRSGMDRKPVKPVSTRQVSLAVLPRPTISISSVGSPLAAKDPIATWNPRRGVGNAIHAGRANLD